MSAPLRLSDELLKEAAAEIELSKRTLPKQIEHWAQLGQKIEPFLKRSDVLALLQGATGVADVKIIPKDSRPVEMDAVLKRIERDRKSGVLESSMARSFWFEESSDGGSKEIVRKTRDGKSERREFVDGTFRSSKKK